MSNWFTTIPSGTAIKRGAQKAGNKISKNLGFGSSSTQPRSTWTKATTPTALPDEQQGMNAKVVMHHFARGHVRTKDQGFPDIYEKVRDKLTASFPKMSMAQITVMIQDITKRLQDSDLTINFMAPAWFTTENTYRTYTQMYERAQVPTAQADGTTKQQMNMEKIGTNGVQVRVASDERAMFGKARADYDPARDMSNKTEGFSRFMKTDGMVLTGNTSGKPAIIQRDGSIMSEHVGMTFGARNASFNPKARQIFSALNYGRRPHGSAVNYGYSHLILNDSLKTNALFYMGDTFYMGSIDTAVTYNTLAGLLVNGYQYDDKWYQELLRATFQNMVLKDSSDAHLLVEAHLFTPVSFSQSVKEIRISGAEVAAKGETARDIEVNAEKFAKTNGIKITWID